MVILVLLHCSRFMELLAGASEAAAPSTTRPASRGAAAETRAPRASGRGTHGAPGPAGEVGEAARERAGVEAHRVGADVPAGRLTIDVLERPSPPPLHAK